MKKQLSKNKATLFVFLMNMLLFVVLTAPFKIWIAASEITEMRPAAALTPVLGMIFGWPAALGCAMGNMICDVAAGYEISYALVNSFLQIIYAMSAYFIWKKMNKERNGEEFRLDSVTRILKFCLLLVINALLTVALTSVLNHAYSVAEIISFDNLFVFINSFDSGLLFGAPLLILGHLLQMHIENLREGKDTKIINFTMSERMILNTLITGLCICVFVGISIYLMARYKVASNVSAIGRVYIYETLALNVYFALSIGFMKFTEQKISQPIEKLAEIVGSYYVGNVSDDERKKMLEDCSVYAKDSTEVGKLARSYISMIEDLETYIENLQSIMSEKERINAELQLASDIQAHMLPCIFPPFPGRTEFDLYALMHPAKEVGGDFYDFFLVNEDKLAIIVADVSGKGVPAALFMVIAKTLIKNYTQMDMDPAEVFTTVNHILCDGNDAGLFVTAWMGVLEIETGKLTYVNAGHNPPLIKKAGGNFEYLRERTGFVLAGMDGIKYRQNSFKLSPGDRIFLYTDGVTESTNEHEELYGEERLQHFLNTHETGHTEEILDALRKDLRDFSNEAPQFDDITMLLLDYKGTVTMKEKVFEAKDENMLDMLGFVEQELENYGCSMRMQTAISVALEEVFINVAHYAYPDGNGTAKVSVGIDPTTDEMTCILRDSGIAFNPLTQDDPDITLPVEQREIGGLGILIVKKTMDFVEYSRENGENILTMRKKLERS